MNRVYPSALDALGRAEVDLEGDDVRVMLLDDTAVYAAADEFLDDLGAVTVGTGVAVPSRTMSGGALSSAASSVTVPAVAGGDTVAAAVLYIHTGTPSTSRLLVWVENQPDTSLIDLLTDGGDIAVALPVPLIRL